MRRQQCVSLLICGLLMLVGTPYLFAGTFISSIDKIAGNAEVPNILDAGLVEGVEAYTDRDHVLLNIHPLLVGADLVQLSNSDKTSVPYQTDVTFARPVSALYIGLDDRLTTQPLAWMNDSAMTGLPNGFFDTGVDIDIDEGNDGAIDQTFSMWVTLAAPAGTYSLYEQDDGGSRNMYILVGSDTLVAIPEPSTLVLACLGVLACITLRRGLRSK